MPIVTQPSDGAIVQGPTVQFQWANTSPNVPGLVSWQLKVGTTIHGWDIYLSPWYPATTLSASAQVPATGDFYDVEVNYMILNDATVYVSPYNSFQCNP